MAKKGLECVLCERHFSVHDIEDGEYCLDTMVCFYCYAKMQAQPYVKSCFGKPPGILMPQRRRVRGYNENAEECQSLCPDRVPCKQIVTGALEGEYESTS